MEYNFEFPAALPRDAARRPRRADPGEVCMARRDFAADPLARVAAAATGTADPGQRSGLHPDAGRGGGLHFLPQARSRPGRLRLLGAGAPHRSPRFPVDSGVPTNAEELSFSFAKDGVEIPIPIPIPSAIPFHPPLGAIPPPPPGSPRAAAGTGSCGDRDRDRRLGERVLDEDDRDLGAVLVEGEASAPRRWSATPLSTVSAGCTSPMRISGPPVGEAGRRRRARAS